jgi:hypothetical protein
LFNIRQTGFVLSTAVLTTRIARYFEGYSQIMTKHFKEELAMNI